MTSTTRRRPLRALACVLAAGLGGPWSPAVRADGKSGSPVREQYTVDTARSRLTVETRTSGLSSMFGHDHKLDVRSLAGNASLVPGALETGAFELVVQADSLWLMEDAGDAVSTSVERALKEDVLETARHPLIVFRGRAAAVEERDAGTFDVRLVGDLRLHGVRRRLSIPARVSTAPGRLRITGAIEIRQSDFKIVPYVFAGGTAKVRDRVVVSFDIVASRLP